MQAQNKGFYLGSANGNLAVGIFEIEGIEKKVLTAFPLARKLNKGHTFYDQFIIGGSNIELDQSVIDWFLNN